jgi:hypothetical protein
MAQGNLSRNSSGVWRVVERDTTPMLDDEHQRAAEVRLLRGRSPREEQMARPTWARGTRRLDPGRNGRSGIAAGCHDRALTRPTGACETGYDRLGGESGTRGGRRQPPHAPRSAPTSQASACPRHEQVARQRDAQGRRPAHVVSGRGEWGNSSKAAGIPAAGLGSSRARR